MINRLLNIIAAIAYANLSWRCQLALNVAKVSLIVGFGGGNKFVQTFHHALFDIGLKRRGGRLVDDARAGRDSRSVRGHSAASVLIHAVCSYAGRQRPS